MQHTINNIIDGGPQFFRRLVLASSSSEIYPSSTRTNVSWLPGSSAAREVEYSQPSHPCKSVTVIGRQLPLGSKTCDLHRGLNCPVQSQQRIQVLSVWGAKADPSSIGYVSTSISTAATAFPI